jgi:uncharacterized membrane protein
VAGLRKRRRARSFNIVLPSPWGFDLRQRPMESLRVNGSDGTRCNMTIPNETGIKTLTHDERQKLAHLIRKTRITRNVHQEFEGKLSFGQRLADAVSKFGGSWFFITFFCAVMLFWVALNATMLARPFDPYPFILLNLLLSTIAALQAPIIMMSQNRQAAKDRAVQQHDYEVNLKAEVEIMALHEKLDELRHKQFANLLEIQQAQIGMLKQLAER